jgi:hypothetical protein
MSEFLTPLRTEYLSGPWFRLLEPLVYRSDLVDTVLTVPKGFVTDFASVPRIPIAYWLFGSKANKAATVHDYLYREGRYSRKTSDRVMLEAMQATGYNWLTRRVMYRCVRMGGMWAYKPTPGCLDYRECKNRDGSECEGCEHVLRPYTDS